MDILAYNLIEWAGGELPWVAKNYLNDMNKVATEKDKLMSSSNIERRLKNCFQDKMCPGKKRTDLLCINKFDLFN